jgi:hypothetical protein
MPKARVFNLENRGAGFEAIEKEPVRMALAA